MTWICRKRTTTTTQTPGGAEAHRQAKENLDTARSKWPEVTRTARSLRELRQRNHFAEQISLIFQGGQHS